MAKQSTQFEGQISMFDFMGLAFPAVKKEAAEAVSFEERRDKVLKKKEDYLNRDEILLTLAKERFERELKHLTLNEFDEKLASLNLSKHDGAEKTASKIAQCVIRPLLSSIESFTDDNEDYMLLKSAVNYDFDIEKVDELDPDWRSGAVMGLRYKYKRSSDIIRLTLRETGWPDLKVYGYRTLSHPAGVCRDGRYRDGSQHADIAFMLAYMVMYSKFMSGMDDADMRGIIVAALTDEYFHMQTSDEMFLSDNDHSYVKEKGLTARELLSEPLTKSQVTVNFNRFERISGAALDYFFEVNGLDKDAYYAEPVCPDGSVSTLNREEKRNGKKKPYRYVLTPWIEWGLFCENPEKAWSEGVGRVRYNALLSRKTRADRYRAFGENIPASWALPTQRRNITYYVHNVICAAFHAIYEHDKQVSQAWNMLSNEKKEHAKVFQTKKAIPAKVVAEMENSVLNNYFGYVEFDESCDLEKVSAISDEFIAFHDTYMPAFDSKNVSIRFRKLGNHKAGGLFFPFYQCLCVDVGSPSSLLHEYGHCIDHSREGGSYSTQSDFYAINAKYKACVTSSVNADSELRERLSRKGRKYNLDYYLSLPESFARCYELYVVKCLGVSNSICRQSEDEAFAYPENEELLLSIERYFSQLLGQYKDAQKEVSAA